MMHPNDRKGLLVVGAAALAGLALMVSGSSEAMTAGHPLSRHTRALGLPQSSEELLAAALEQEFGSHAQPRPPAVWQEQLPDLGDAQHLQRGRALYQKNCMHCHGWSGGADTPTARILRPRPRDFGLGILKYGSTPTGIPPTRTDVERILRQGVPSTAMASFGALPEDDLAALVDYTRFQLMRAITEFRLAAALEQLGRFGEDTPLVEREAHLLNGLDLSVQSVAANWSIAEAMALQPQVPAATPESVDRGRDLFLGTKAACWMCHGKDGAGRGPGAWDRNFGWLLKDAWGEESRPRDMAFGQFHGGSAVEDLYRRISIGVEGTPMASYQTTLSDAEISDLVHYILSLSNGGGQ